MKALLFAAYFAAVGYGIGKLDLDVKIARALRAGTTEFIAYAKAVPPAEPVFLATTPGTRMHIGPDGVKFSEEGESLNGH